MESEWAVMEMAGAELADARQVTSITRICAALEERPELSFSAACGPALRQAAHRIFEHPGTTVSGLLAGHFGATAARCRDLPFVLIAQDTAAFSYTQNQIVGLAPLNQSRQTRGLLGHGALALTPTGTPLGLLHLELWGSDELAPPVASGTRRAPEHRESYKWYEGLHSVARWLPEGTAGLLIQDREADIFGLLTTPRPARLQLLVRAAHDRTIHYARSDEVSARATSCRVAGGALQKANGEKGSERQVALLPPGTTERGRLFAVAASAPPLATLRVQVPRQSARGKQGPQPAREAILEVRVTEVRLQRPKHEPASAGLPAEVTVWVIYAEEVTEPEAEEERVRWVLLSTLPVADGEQACQMVGYYARRWVIERLHFTLKSGLRVERLQFDDAISLGHALALYYVVACRLLQLTYLARHEPERPATEWLTPAEVAALTATARAPVQTVAEAVAIIARLGGYTPYRTAPPPGVKVLWLGLQRLHGMAEGWRLAFESMNQQPDL